MCVCVYISKSLCLCVVVKCWSTATWLSIRPARPNTLSLPAYLVLSQRGSVDVGWSDISLWLRNSPAEKRVRHFRPGQWLGTNTDAVFLLLCPSPRRAAALGCRHAGCLQLSHVRTADPSADGRRSAASWTAICGGHIISPLLRWQLVIIKLLGSMNTMLSIIALPDFNTSCCLIFYRMSMSYECMVCAAM